jgi:hypothetical protein
MALLDLRYIATSVNRVNHHRNPQNTGSICCDRFLGIAVISRYTQQKSLNTHIGKKKTGLGLYVPQLNW